MWILLSWIHNLLKHVIHFLLFLGRPFLATANTLINYRHGLMKLSFGNMTLEMNIFNICKQPEDDNDLQDKKSSNLLIQCCRRSFVKIDNRFDN
jgi:hypothetical protein